MGSQGAETRSPVPKIAYKQPSQQTENQQKRQKYVAERQEINEERGKNRTTYQKPKQEFTDNQIQAHQNPKRRRIINQ